MAAVDHFAADLVYVADLLAKNSSDAAIVSALNTFPLTDRTNVRELAAAITAGVASA